ncbi:MAG: monovalent cation/H(+) antiporter subunit G [Methanobacteriota archaeon]
MNIILELLSLLFISIGCFVMLSAALGLYRFPDIYMRLHSSTKVNTGGAMTLLFGLMLRTGISALSAKIFIIIALIFILTPVVSHAIARSAHLQSKTPIISFEAHPKKKYEYHDFFRRKQ